MYQDKLLPRCAADVKELLVGDDDADLPDFNDDVVYLWDDRGGAVASGQSHGADEFEVPW